MNGELIVRAALNDHQVVADLLAPGGAAVMIGNARPVISRVIVDAPSAARRPQFAEAAAGAGVPFLVDPLTPLLQGETRDEDPWAQLDFGRPAETGVSAFAERVERAAYVQQVIDFQLAAGATALIPPYPYVHGPEDAWFAVALDWVRLTREYLNSLGVALPVVPVFCGQLMSFGAERAWDLGLDRFAATAADIGASAIGVCLSPVGSGKDSYHKVWRLFQAFSHIREVFGGPVIAWRQGVFGPALVASGMDGYETGMGISEQSNVRSNIAARRPPKPGADPGRGGSSGVYIEPLGRSVNPRVARILLAEMGMRAKIMCTDERCCPQGVTSTLDHSREHAVRSRARELATLSALPARSWRLNHIVTKTNGAVTLAKQANRVLAQSEEALRIHTLGLEALARVAEELRRADSEGRIVA